MALDSGKLQGSLKSTLKSELDAALGPAPDEGDGHRQKFCSAFAKAISEEIVKHIKENLEIVGVQVQVEAGSYLVSAAGGAGATGTVPGTPIIGTPSPAPLSFSQSPPQQQSGLGLVK